MAELSCKDYTGVTRASINKWREESARSGVTLPEGDSFTVEKSGVKISVDYAESSGTVKVCIVEKPGFIPESMVWSIVDSQMKG
jgi:hypothetical protein